MRACHFTALVLFALVGMSLLASPAQGGGRHWSGYGHGCGYGGYGYGGYGYVYGGYGYGGYAYGGYGYPGYWSEPMAYAYSPGYSTRAYSYRPAYGSQPYAANGSQPYDGQPAERSPSDATARTTAARPTTLLEIGAHDNYFQPNNITVKPGTTVRWTNRGGHGHTVTSHHNLFDSGDIQPGATYRATFTHPGNYYYYCRHHTGEAMRGVITVEDPAVAAAGREPARAPAETARRPNGPARSPRY
jgi:plastocyanin